MGIFSRILSSSRSTSSSSKSNTSRTSSQSSPEKSKSLTFEDYLRFRELAFEWADSYDCKDWVRLRAICAPTVQVDYTEVSGNEYKDVPADKFVAFCSHPGFLGDQLIHTQHLLGATKIEQVSADEVHAYIQIRAAHQRYTDASRSVVENKGHGHAMIKHSYVRQPDGQWKFAGLRPSVRWNEFSFDKIFVHFDPRGVMEPDVQRMELVTGSAGDAIAPHSAAALPAPGSIEVSVGAA